MKKLLLHIVILFTLAANTYAITPVGIRLIKSFEGCRLTAYQDWADIWTIGFGTTKGVYPGMTITMLQAEQMLIDYIRPMEIYIVKKVNRPLPWWQLDALDSFCYNLGKGTLKGNFLVKIQNDSRDASNEFLKYNKARDKKTGRLTVLNGLTKRRNAEKRVYDTRTF